MEVLADIFRIRSLRAGVEVVPIRFLDPGDGYDTCDLSPSVKIHEELFRLVFWRQTKFRC